MDDSRRTFLKVAGCSVLGALCGSAASKALATGSLPTTEKYAGSLNATRWAMVIDLKRSKREDVRQAAQDACHMAHNVPDIRIKEEEVKWIWTETYEHAFPFQVHPHTEASLKKAPVLVMCNHCQRPSCVRVCPTQATWRREEDGIVMMDMHRCIGCRYCMAACPYGSRSFNWRDPRPEIKEPRQSDFPTRTKGVVEKCNFCAERLAKGQLPACVEAVEKIAGKGVMTFGDLNDKGSEVARILRRRHSIRRKPTLGTGPQVYYIV
jgi:molybdopterin-containing oxidoreductase family iron-sulfur binding subunit